MKLKKTIAYEMLGLDGERVIFIKSGFPATFLQVTEDSSYNISVSFIPNEASSVDYVEVSSAIIECENKQ